MIYFIASFSYGTFIYVAENRPDARVNVMDYDGRLSPAKEFITVASLEYCESRRGPLFYSLDEFVEVLRKECPPAIPMIIKALV
jgi:hypothetical protein